MKHTELLNRPKQRARTFFAEIFFAYVFSHTGSERSWLLDIESSLRRGTLSGRAHCHADGALASGAPLGGALVSKALGGLQRPPGGVVRPPRPFSRMRGCPQGGPAETEYLCVYLCNDIYFSRKNLESIAIFSRMCYNATNKVFLDTKTRRCAYEVGLRYNQAQRWAGLHRSRHAKQRS